MHSEILRTTGDYPDEEVRLFEREVKVRHVTKNELLLKEGQVAKSVYYLLKGSAQQYKLVSESKHNVIDLHIAGDWFLNYKSLITQSPSEVFIESFTDSAILEVSLETVHHLIGKSFNFIQLNRVLEGAVARMQFFDQSMTPYEKYSFILNHHPRLIQAFPLKIISSYLKVTPETLSRVRKLIMKGGIS